jgi:glycosyltransferase involved in cell wall biosynthesis
MLIGIDASRATAARRTGTENYALHLIRELLALNQADPASSQSHHFRLYFNQAPEPSLFPPAAEMRVMPFPRVWTHVRLSWEMATQPPDLLFVPSHVLPLVHPQHSVVTVHDLGYLYYPEAHTWFQNRYLRWSTRYNAKSALRVLADSEATRQDLVHHCQIPQEKIKVVYPGRDETLEPVGDSATLGRIRARYNLQLPYYLYLGTLQPRKNLVRLVQAFGRFVQGSGTEQNLVLAGKKGWHYDEIETQIHALGLEDRIILTGYVADLDLASLLSGALAFVFPSLYEGFGFPVLEAMACGTPVICSNTSSLPEIAGDAAILVDPLDVDALAAAMHRVAHNEGLRQSLIERGFQQMQSFSWERCAKEVMQVLVSARYGLS